MATGVHVWSLQGKMWSRKGDTQVADTAGDKHSFSSINQQVECFCPGWDVSPSQG